MRMPLLPGHFNSQNSRRSALDVPILIVIVCVLFAVFNSGAHGQQSNNKEAINTNNTVENANETPVVPLCACRPGSKKRAYDFYSNMKNRIEQ